MNNEISMGKRIKDLLARKTLPTVLAGSMLFSGAFANEAQAYSLDEPNQSYEDFLNYDGIRVFINGRYVEFTESTGFPFVENGSTMIPLRAVSEAFGAKVDWNSYSNTASVSKFDLNVAVPVGGKEMKVKDLNDDSTNTVSVTKEALVRDGITYIPLRSLFECFGLNVRWDGEKKIAHIETVDVNSFDYISFKNNNVLSIKDVDVQKYERIVYDGNVIDKNYVEILKNSNQYKVVEVGTDLNILSYQFLSELNYIYGINNKMINAMNNGEIVDFVLRNARYEDREFLSQVYSRTFSDFRLSVSYREDDEVRKDYIMKPYVKQTEYQLMLEKAKEIANKARSEGKTVREQIDIVVQILNESVSYDYKNESRNDAYGALILNKTKCSGYSWAFLAILSELGIPCVYKNGAVNNGKDGHGWNDVYLDEEWFICDATNNRSLVDMNDSYYDSFGNNYNEEVELIKLTYKFDNK